jgi:DNA-binding transcriptional LysR family regulator
MPRERLSRTWDKVPSSSAFRMVSIGMALGSTEAIKRVVAEGVGLAIVSRLSVQAECAAGTLTMDQGAAAARARRQGLCLGAVTIDGDNSTLTINRRKTHGA